MQSHSTSQAQVDEFFGGPAGTGRRRPTGGMLVVNCRVPFAGDWQPGRPWGWPAVPVRQLPPPRCQLCCWQQRHHEPWLVLRLRLFPAQLFRRQCARPPQSLQQLRLPPPLPQLLPWPQPIPSPAELSPLPPLWGDMRAGVTRLKTYSTTHTHLQPHAHAP